MPGRLINDEISRSRRVASLSPKALALFTLLIPHFNAHGKMNGEPSYIKGQVCPLIPWLNEKNIGECLAEISDKTNVKWFIVDGLRYLHSLNWQEHQPGLRKLGQDRLPDYPERSRGSPGTLPEHSPNGSNLVPPEVEVEVLSRSRSFKCEGEGRALKGPKHPHGEFQNVKLSQEEHEKLLGRLGKESTEFWISELDSAIQSKGLRYKDHYATILNWEKKEGKRRKDEWGTVK